MKRSPRPFRGDWVTPDEARWGLILVLPVMALFLALKVAPLFYAGYLSLTQYSLLQPPTFIGFDNYVRLFNDTRALNAFRVTLIYTAGTVIPATILSLTVAMMLNSALRGMGEGTPASVVVAPGARPPVGHRSRTRRPGAGRKCGSRYSCWP